MKKAVTIQTIADALGVSRNTVSKALNGHPCPPKTKEAVIRKAQQLGYKSFDSEILTSKKYRILLFSGKPFHNIEFFLPLAKSIENYCYQHNFTFFQYTSNPRQTSLEKIRESIRGMEVDGIVAIETFDPVLINGLVTLDIPVCFIDFAGRMFPYQGKFDVLTTSDQKIICDCVKGLIQEQSARHFTFVGDFRHCLSFHERYMGMLRGISRSDLEHYQKEDICESDDVFDYGNPDALKEKIAKLPYFPDCFVCCNDFVARRVIMALKRLGRKVPQDTMVTGFDGVSDASEPQPTITTFVVEKECLGIEALEILMSRIRRPTTPIRIVYMDCPKRSGESTQRLPKSK